MAGTEACHIGAGYDIVRLLLRIQRDQPHSVFTLIGEDLSHPQTSIRINAIRRYSSLSRLAGTHLVARYSRRSALTT